jgi:carboxymethylenebutenolidase
MGKFIELSAADGHKFSAYEAKPAGKAKAGLVVVPEIFGVNAHIRAVADGYAADGYHVLALAVFDRVERDFDRGYGPEDREAGIAIMKAMKPAETLSDVSAAVDRLKREGGKVGLVGYCFGGSIAYLAASAVPGLSASIGYYGGMIANNLDKKPKVPVLLQFGDEDHGIPVESVEKIRAALDPKMVRVFRYAGAGHAFNRAGTASWHEPSAKLARERTLAFLKEHVG